MSLLSKMIKFVVDAHDGQLDKAGQPYIFHCLKVMHYLKTDDIQLQCIALGHDLLEDTKTTKLDIINLTDSCRIMQGIIDLTKTKEMSQEEYEFHVMSNSDAMLVKLCDLKHNSDIRRLKGITNKDIARLDKYCKFYNKIKDKLNF